MFELKAEKYRKELYQVINNSELPVSLAYYILKDIIKELENIYQQNIVQQMADEENGTNTEVHDVKVPMFVEELEEENKHETE